MSTPRPKTRGECPDIRPCLHITCRYHLFGDHVERTAHGDGRKFPHRPRPDMPAADMDALIRSAQRWLIAVARTNRPSCALDVADQGAITLEEAGELLIGRDGRRITRERVRQLEGAALKKLRNNTPRRLLTGLRDTMEAVMERGGSADPE